MEHNEIAFQSYKLMFEFICIIQMAFLNRRQALELIFSDLKAK